MTVPPSNAHPPPSRQLPLHGSESTASESSEELRSRACSDAPATESVRSEYSGGSGGSGSSMQPRTILPKALPDPDDLSMKNVFEYIQQYEQDLYWSFLSDTFFITGGALYVVLSLWDVLQQQQDTTLYKLFDVLAPTVYLLNSIVDVEWAYRVKRRLGALRAVTDTWNDWRLLLDLDDPGEAEEEDDDEAGGACARVGCRPSWYRRLRKHSAHRRTIIAAFMFGVAAVSGLLAILFNDDNHARLATVADSVSVYSYIISAVISCSGKRTRPWLHTDGLGLLQDPEALEDLGDIMFLVGSLSDGVLFVLELAEDNPGWSVFSSVLWCIDACLYLRSDIIMHGRLRQQQLEGSALV